MEIANTSPHKQAFAELLAVIFMGAVALAAQTTGFMLLLFPELAALSHDIMTRPYGKWGSQPLRLVLTPTLTAIVGIFFTRRLPFGALGIALIVTFDLEMRDGRNNPKWMSSVPGAKQGVKIAPVNGHLASPHAGCMFWFRENRLRGS